MIPAYVGHHSISLRDQRRKISPLDILTRRRSRRDTSCLCTCAFIVFFQKTEINLPSTRKNTTTTASIPSVFFLSFSFVFGNGGGEHAKGRGTPCKGQSWIRFWIPLPGFQIPGTGFRSLLLKFGFWIRIFSRVPDSLSCILDSKIQDSGFDKKKLPGFRNLDFLDMEREEEAPAVNALAFPFSTISGSA